MDKVITEDMLNEEIRHLLGTSARLLTGDFDREVAIYESGFAQGVYAAVNVIFGIEYEELSIENQVLKLYIDSWEERITPFDVKGEKK